MSGPMPSDEVLTVEMHLNIGALKIPFSITIKRDSLDDVVGAIAEQAAGSVGILDLLRKK